MWTSSSTDCILVEVSHQLMNKLPEVTLLFWIMKIAATTLGETAGDLLSMTLKVGYLDLQVEHFSSRRYWH